MALPGPPKGPSWVVLSYSRPLLGTAWALWAIATISLGARYFIRYRRFSRLFWDDLFVAIGFIFSILLGMQFTLSNLHGKYSKSGRISVFNNRLLTQFIFYSCLWSIKISFLIFFHKMACVPTGLRRLKYYWRAVAGFTILSYFILFLITPFKCYVQKGVEACNDDPVVRRLIPHTFTTACALDITTDVLIMAIPFVVLYRVQQLPLRKRLILYSIFSLVIITMIVAIVRAVYSANGMGKRMDLTMLLFLSFIEGITTNTVASLGSLRTLFTQDSSRTPAYRTSTPRRRDFQRTNSSDALHSTDLQYMSPVHLKPPIDSQLSDYEGPRPPNARLREDIYVPVKS